MSQKTLRRPRANLSPTRIPARMTVPPNSSDRQDYDNPWKDILESYFPDCLAFFFPGIHAEIDWERGFEFLDTELRQLTREAVL